MTMDLYKALRRITGEPEDVAAVTSAVHREEYAISQIRAFAAEVWMDPTRRHHYGILIEALARATGAGAGHSDLVEENERLRARVSELETRLTFFLSLEVK